MARALPSVIPPNMYRHFALVTVLLTGTIAMFADGENREAAAAQIEQQQEQETREQQASAKAAAPTIERRVTVRQRFARHSRAFDGFDPSFGAPMDKTPASRGSYTAQAASPVAQTGYSDSYLASLDPNERALLLDGLEKDGMLSPQERERKTAALIASSEARSGAPSANY